MGGCLDVWNPDIGTIYTTDMSKTSKDRLRSFWNISTQDEVLEIVFALLSAIQNRLLGRGLLSKIWGAATCSGQFNVNGRGERDVLYCASHILPPAAAPVVAYERVMQSWWQLSSGRRLSPRHFRKD